jgi:hypothetical protein
MKQKIVVILLLTALLVATGAALAKPGEDSDRMGEDSDRMGEDSDRLRIVSKWDTLFGKEGGDEGIFLSSVPVDEN